MPTPPPAEHIHTPFGDLLQEFMWSRRPPLTTGQLSTRLSISRNTLQSWIYRGTVPSVDIALHVLAKLNIPVERALHAYQQAGAPIPPLAEPSPPHHQPPDAWTALIQQTQADLHAAGVDEHTIGAVVDRIRARQIGSDQPLRANIAAEHELSTELSTTVRSVPPDEPEVTRRATPEPDKEPQIRKRKPSPSRPK